MSTITVSHTASFTHRTVVNVISTSWSVEQVQVLAGLVFAQHRLDYSEDSNTETYTLDGDVMKDSYGEEAFTWNGDVIIARYLHDDDVEDSICRYLVSREHGYLTISCTANRNGDSVNITFKDGKLESIADAAAVVITDPISKRPSTQMWFRENICYRAANPTEPADICFGWHAHYNSHGIKHRDVKQGPAYYLIEDGELVENEEAYYHNGVECQDDGSALRRIKLYPHKSSWHTVPEQIMPSTGEPFVVSGSN